MTWTVFAGALLATSIEVVEVVAIVVAVGVSRSWRAALSGAAAGLGVLIVLVAGLGPALQDVSLAPLRIVVGSLLMIFGLGWLRKGILRVSRDGWAAGGAGSGDVDAPYGPARGFDSTAFVISFKGVSLEGLEIAVIVVALGSAAGDLASASAGAAVAVVALSALGALAHRAVARIPRRSMQLVVGVMLTSFGTFWAAEGAGVHWPGGEWALAILTAGYLVMSLTGIRWARRLRAASDGGGPVAPAPAGEAA